MSAFSPAKRIRELALSWPETYEDEPWGHPVFKVGENRMFAAMSVGEPLELTLKLTPEEREIALHLPYVRKARYVGRYGWVTVTVTDEESLEAALEWLRESYWLPVRPRSSGRRSSSRRSRSDRPLKRRRLRCRLQDARALPVCPSALTGRAGGLKPTRPLSRPGRPRGAAQYPWLSMRVVLPDSSELELPDGATGLDAAAAIGPKLAEEAVLLRSNGRVQDLRLPLEDGQQIQILTTRDSDDPDALAVLRHSTAHLLAEAVRRLYPGVKIAIGPPIENGFYYDFEFPEPISEADLPRIEAEIRRELAEGREWKRQEVSRKEARRRFLAEQEDYKVELVEDAEEPISFYTQGDFTDLCRGPHLRDSGPIKAVKLTGLAGAYWRGDERNTQLTRIYGTAFYEPSDLDAYLERLEEAKRRDHRRLGPQLDLFHLSEEAPGMPFWHPKGVVIWNALEDLRRRENAERGYVEVKTPLMYDAETWRTSGHLEKFRDSMFFVPYTEERTLGLKPMNCPGHMLLFGSRLRSYRDLAIRYAESSTLHRDERAGVLHGLLRVQHITQDDAHIFCAREQIEQEIFGCLDYAAYLYDLFGMEARFELSTRPEDKLGTDEEWDFTEGALRAALERRGLAFDLNEGDGAFYGPKIDLHMTDVLGRSWQMGTIQLDAQMPKRFGLTYMGADNQEHTPYVIHRALLGSLERFIGILIEHYGGAFPLWLAPVQLRLIPVGEAHREAAAGIRGRLAVEGFRADLDERDETVGKRIRDAELEKIPYVIVYGDRESEESLAVRTRGGDQSSPSLEGLIEELRAETEAASV